MKSKRNNKTRREQTTGRFSPYMMACTAKWLRSPPALGSAKRTRACFLPGVKDSLPCLREKASQCSSAARGKPCDTSGSGRPSSSVRLSDRVISPPTTRIRRSSFHMGSRM